MTRTTPDTMPQDGGCLCGAVRFRARAAPLAAGRCHCRSCRLATGSAGVAWVIFDREAFAFVRGVDRLIRFQSSPGVVRTFCGTCGTSIGYEADDAPGRIEITTSTFDDPGRFPPTRESWLEDRVPWAPLDPSLEHYGRGSSEQPTLPADRSGDRST